MHLCSFHPTSSIFIHHVAQAPCQSLQCVSSLTTSRVSCDARNGEGNLQTFSQIWGNRYPRFSNKFIHSVAAWIAWPYHENNLPGKEDGAKGFWGPAGPTLWEPVPCNREFNKTRRWSKLIVHKQINLPRLSILWNCWVIAMVPAGSTVIITQIVSPKKFPVAW